MATTQPARIARRVTSMAVVPLLVAAVLGAVTLALRDLSLPADPDPDRAAELAVPASGTVQPAWLPDGSPVFVVNGQDGVVRVLSAVSPHVTSFAKAVVWCPSSGWFEELQHGSKFASNGAWVGGPAPTGLASHDLTRVGDRVRVGPARPGPARGALPTHEPTGPHCGEDVPDRRTVAHAVEAAPPLGRVLGRATDGWEPASATIAWQADGLWLCARQPAGVGCTGGVALGRRPAPAPHATAGTVLVRTGPDGTLAEPPILLAPAWDP